VYRSSEVTLIFFRTYRWRVLKTDRQRLQFLTVIQAAHVIDNGDQAVHLGRNPQPFGFKIKTDPVSSRVLFQFDTLSFRNDIQVEHKPLQGFTQRMAGQPGIPKTI